MHIEDRKGLEIAAAQALRIDPNHKQLVMVSTGVAAGLSLVVSLLSFALEGQIAQTGGLAGLGMRSVLTTVQAVLFYAVLALTPFWDRGFASAMLKLSRHENVTIGTLLDGFRRLGPVLRLMLLQGVLYFFIASGCVYIGSSVFAFTPLAAPMYEILLESDVLTTGVIDDATMAELAEAGTPVLLGCLGLFLLVAIPITYRLRLADLRVLDEPRCGAIAAMLESSRAMHHNCIALFKLDLHFWWFYLAEGAVAALCYGDKILPALGVRLPFSEDTAYFVFYVIGIAAQLLLYWYARARVSVTYAKAYDALRPRQQ